MRLPSGAKRPQGQGSFGRPGAAARASDRRRPAERPGFRRASLARYSVRHRRGCAKSILDVLTPSVGASRAGAPSISSPVPGPLGSSVSRGARFSFVSRRCDGGARACTADEALRLGGVTKSGGRTRPIEHRAGRRCLAFLTRPYGHSLAEAAALASLVAGRELARAGGALQ